MKLSRGESNGPVLPVWQTVKGLSSKEPGRTASGSRKSSVVEGTHWKLLESGSVLTGDRLCTDNPILENLPNSERRKSSQCSFPKLPSDLVVATDKEVHPEFDPQLGNPYYSALLGLSSSTTSTSLSNANVSMNNNGTAVAAKDEDAIFEEDSQAFRYRHPRIGSKKLRRRVVHKNGECNVTQSNVAKRRRRYLQDIFTTLVDIQWRWTLLVFAASFLMSWLSFAVFWYGMSFLHGDLQPGHLPKEQEKNGWNPCIMNVFGFTSCFLFSIETQHTIGYGSRFTTEQCPEAIFVLCMQSITGVMIQAFMVGVVFAKLSRPKKRTQTLMFSRNACVCQRDGELCLLFRVGDMRKSHIIEAHIRAELIRRRETREGEILPFFQNELNVGYDVGTDRIFFIWPMTIVHKIDETSPLYDISAHDLLREKFEIVVMLEGVIESTGMTTQARSSYLPNEILWGYRFESLVFFKRDTGEYTVDYSLFNNTCQVTTPLCSARHLDRCRSRGSTPVTPSTPLTPLSPLTPMTPQSFDLDQKKGNTGISFSTPCDNRVSNVATTTVDKTKDSLGKKSQEGASSLPKQNKDNLEMSGVDLAEKNKRPNNSLDVSTIQQDQV